MRVLVACEYSGRVREAFRAKGHDAFSCDLLPSEDDSPYHYQEDVWELLAREPYWDLIIFHPECTFHTNASVRWFTTIPKHPKPGVFYGREREREWAKAVRFFKRVQGLYGKNTPHLAIENPIMHDRSRNAVGRCTQIIQPWQFGHKEMKATCLWLYGLPPLEPTNIVGPPPKDKIERRKWAKVHLASPGPDRWKLRSRTYPGIADAMAERWG